MRGLSLSQTHYLVTKLEWLKSPPQKVGNSLNGGITVRRLQVGLNHLLKRLACNRLSIHVSKINAARRKNAWPFWSRPETRSCTAASSKIGSHDSLR
jgi:hypothetical protein